MASITTYLKSQIDVLLAAKLGSSDARYLASDAQRRFSERRQRVTPPIQQTFADKANTTAGVVPALDLGSASIATFDNGNTGAAVRVSGGYLTFAPTASGNAAGYMSGNAGAPVTLLGCRWKWDKTGRTTDGASVCMTITDAQMTAYAAPFANAGVHLVIAPYGWQVKYVTGGSSATLSDIASGQFATALKQDNLTEYECQVFRSGSTIRILLPDGSITAAITDTNIGSKSGPGFYFEPFATNGDTDAITKIRDVWVGTGGQVTPSSQPMTRQTFDQLGAWEPTIKGLNYANRAVGMASMPFYVNNIQTIGALLYILGTADASGSMTVKLQSATSLTGAWTDVAGSSATIAAGALQGIVLEPITIPAGVYLRIYISAVGGTPGFGCDCRVIRP